LANSNFLVIPDLYSSKIVPLPESEIGGIRKRLFKAHFNNPSLHRNFDPTKPRLSAMAKLRELGARIVRVMEDGVMQHGFFQTAMRSLSLFAPNPDTMDLANAVAEVTGIPLVSLQIAERQIAYERSFAPLKRLLTNPANSNATRLKYRIGLKHARKARGPMSRTHYLAHAILLTIATEKGIVDVMISILVAYPGSGSSGQEASKQEIVITTRYTIHRGIRRSTFRQKIKLRDGGEKQVPLKPSSAFAPHSETQPMNFAF